jgi:hypothetical protein
VLFLLFLGRSLLFPLPSLSEPEESEEKGKDWFSGFQDWRTESRRRQWSFDHLVAERGAVTGDEGIGEEDTNVTALLGLAFLESNLVEGVLRGERRQDLVGEAVGRGVCTGTALDWRRRDSVHFRVLFCAVWFSFPSFEITEEG